MNEENLPSFLINKKEEKNMKEVKKTKKMMNSTKKISIKKNKNSNLIDHDKQSTTMEENDQLDNNLCNICEINMINIVKNKIYFNLKY